MIKLIFANQVEQISPVAAPTRCLARLSARQTLASESGTRLFPVRLFAAGLMFVNEARETP